MEYYDLCNDKLDKIDEIQTNVFLYTPYYYNILERGDVEIFHNMVEISKRTSKMFVYINHPVNKVDFNQIKKISDISTIKWISVDVQVGMGATDANGQGRIYQNSDHDSILAFEKLHQQFQAEKKLIPTFVLTGNHYQLGPTILKFFEKFNLDFAFINPLEELTIENANKYREAFEYLRLRGFKKHIYFSQDKEHEKWNANSLNTFSGLKYLHLDLSNKCTHSCVFCGLWGPDFVEDIKKNEGGKISEQTKNFMNQQLPFQKAMDFLNKTPETLHQVQLGGAGDPLTHPNWLEIISHLRTRGLSLEVLSNFEYPTFAEIEKLHELSRGKKDLLFMVNISSGTRETYSLVRPRQAPSVFDKVIDNIAYARDLKVRDGYGIKFTIVNIINKYNFREMELMLDVAAFLGASVWLKPLEIHSHIHKNYSIPPEFHLEFKEIVKRVLIRANERRIKLVLPEVLEAIAQDEVNQIPT